VSARNTRSSQKGERSIKTTANLRMGKLEKDACPEGRRRGKFGRREKGIIRREDRIKRLGSPGFNSSLQARAGEKR